jgi:hypothetical protein
MLAYFITSLNLFYLFKLLLLLLLIINISLVVV